MELPEDSTVTAGQHEIATGVASRLSAADVEFSVDLRRDGEPFYLFELHVPSELDLSIRIYVACDTFQIEANGADLRFDMWDAANDPAEWVKHSLDTLSSILGADLRLRIRRTLSGGTTGAIWVPRADGGGSWNGDLFAAFGLGRNRVYRPWPSGSSKRAV